MGSVHAFQIGRGLLDCRPRKFSRAAAPKKRIKRGFTVVSNQTNQLFVQPAAFIEWKRRKK
jgi:hypothetical protein